MLLNKSFIVDGIYFQHENEYVGQCWGIKRIKALVLEICVTINVIEETNIFMGCHVAAFIFFLT